MSELVQSVLTPSVFDEILRQEPERGRTFVVLLGPVEFKFRAYGDHGEYNKFKREAIEFAKTNRKKARCPEAWKSIHISDAETWVAIYLISDRSLEPKITHLDGLKLAYHAPMRFEALVQAIGNQLLPDIEDNEDIESGKDESGPTPDSATD